MLAFSLACSASGNAQDPPTSTASPPAATSTLAPASTPTPLPTETVTPAPAPTAGPLADRTSCDGIRGTAYRSATEREFFLASCTAGVAAPPPTIARAPGDRTNCDEIRGTAYRSPAEREFFLANCISGQPTSTPSNPIVSPAGGATAIGDSVMLGAATYLQANIAGLYLDARVSEQADAAIAVLQQRAQANQLGSLVIVHIGNNGTYTQAEFDQLMGMLASVPRVVIVNISVPRSWEGPNNDMIAANVGRYANMRLVDWHTAALNHPEYFWDDRVHLRPAGAAVYAAMVAYAAAVKVRWWDKEERHEAASLRQLFRQHGGSLQLLQVHLRR